MKKTDRSESRNGMLRNRRSRQLAAGMLEAAGHAQKLQALPRENLSLERHLAELVRNNRTLQSLW